MGNRDSLLMRNREVDRESNRERERERNLSMRTVLDCHDTKSVARQENDFDFHVAWQPSISFPAVTALEICEIEKLILPNPKGARKLNTKFSYPH